MLSTAFPVVASVLKLDPSPRWLGILDVVVAIVLVVAGLAIVSRKPADFSTQVVGAVFRTYRHLANTLLVLLVLFFILGERIGWTILLPGLAWRAWLLVLVLPSWTSLWQAGKAEQAGRATDKQR